MEIRRVQNIGLFFFLRYVHQVQTISLLSIGRHYGLVKFLS